MKKEHIKKMHEQAERVFNYAEKEIDYRESWRIFRIMAEFVEGYQFLSEMKNEVTILGSARLPVENKYCEIAHELGAILGKNEFSVLTGGGPGIMEAGNHGAFEVGGKSYGLNIELPFEQILNPYVNKFASFNYFFTRKVMLTSPATAFVMFPGGYGTMDEFFEIVDLMDLGMMQKVPIILVGREFWQPLLDFMSESPCSLGSVDPAQVKSWHVVETAEEAYEIIAPFKDKPLSPELKLSSFHHAGSQDWRIFRIMSELVAGFEFLTTVKNDITVLGSSHITPDQDYYQVAYELGSQLAQYGYMTLTGGGIGIAEAANKGAYENKGVSIGLGLQSGETIEMNKYLNKSLSFIFPFTRKLIVTAPSKGFVFFPGGLGTLHHLFEVLTLMQTKKMPRRPVILYDHKFWGPLHKFIKEELVSKFATISPEDDELYQMVDSLDSIIEVIENSRTMVSK